MKVAIIGAGVSGLSCALELKRHGIIPTIFERNSHIEQEMNFITVTQTLFHRAIGDPIRHIKKNYGLSLKPLSPVKRIIMKGPQSHTVVKGKLGYYFKRGDEKYSISNQIFSKLNIPIQFDSYINIDDIKNDYDYIIVATGDYRIAKKLNVWNTTINTFVRIATVLGSFNLGTVKMWLNTKYAKNCFVFLTVNSKKQAYIALTVDNITHNDLDFYWNEFLQIEEISCPIIELNDHEQNIGFSYPVQVDNIIFVGNSAGMIDSFMGFGTFNSIESGFLAARSIIYGLDYSRLIQPIVKHVKALDQLRNAINTFDNDDYDRLLRFLGTPVIKQLIYNNPLSRASNVAFIAKLYSRFYQKNN